MDEPVKKIGQKEAWKIGAFKPGHKFGGRPKGSKNKLSRDLKQDVIRVFIKLGATRGMTQWAVANPTDFYTKIFARIVPTETAATIAATVTQTITHKFDLTKLTFEELQDIQAKLSRARLAETVGEEKN